MPVLGFVDGCPTIYTPLVFKGRIITNSANGQELFNDHKYFLFFTVEQKKSELKNVDMLLNQYTIYFRGKRLYSAKVIGQQRLQPQ